MAQPFCCNPFNIAGHSWSSRKKNLRPVKEWMCEKAPHITLGLKICDTCRKKLSDLSAPLSTPLLEDPNYQSPEETDFSDKEYKPAEAQKTVDEFLVGIGETPYSKSKARGKTYPKEKLKAITEAMQRVILTDEVMDDGREMLQQLKEKFKVTADKRVQLQIFDHFAPDYSKDSRRVWCVLLHGAKSQRVGKGKGSSISSWSQSWASTGS